MTNHYPYHPPPNNQNDDDNNYTFWLALSIVFIIPAIIFIIVGFVHSSNIDSRFSGFESEYLTVLSTAWFVLALIFVVLSSTFLILYAIEKGNYLKEQIRNSVKYQSKQLHEINIILQSKYQTRQNDENIHY